MTVVRPIGTRELAAIAAVHRLAFPDRGLSLLGDEAVRRYYDWQLTGPHDSVALGAFDGPALVGFCVAGVFRGAMSGFLRTNRAFLARRLVTRPGLLADVVVRDRARRAIGALARRRPRTVPAPAGGASFGILAVAVAPACRRRGVGRQLVAAVEDVARARGFDRIGLTVDAGNDAAIRFYEALGWVRTPAGAAWSGRMERSIDAPRPT